MIFSGFEVVNAMQGSPYVTVGHTSRGQSEPLPTLNSPAAFVIFWLIVGGVALAIYGLVRAGRRQTKNTLQRSDGQSSQVSLSGFKKFNAWSDKVSSGLFKAALIVGAVSLALYQLAILAFGADAVTRFLDNAQETAHWLDQSPQGRSVAAFALMALLVIGGIAFVRSRILRSFGYAAYGWGQVALGVVLVSYAGDSWYQGQLRWYIALGLGFVSLFLMSYGSENIRIGNAHRQQAPTRQMQPQTLPPQTVYGDAREPTFEEIDRALRSVGIHAAAPREERFDD